MHKVITWCTKAVEKGNLWNKCARSTAQPYGNRRIAISMKPYSGYLGDKKSNWPHLNHIKSMERIVFGAKGLFCLLPFAWAIISIWEILLYRCVGSQHTLTLGKNFQVRQKATVQQEDQNYFKILNLTTSVY